jgi:hypothetical protein
MAMEISYDCMALEINGEVVATACFSEYAAAEGSGAWVVSTHAARLVVAYGDDDPFVKSWRAELYL